MSFNYKRVRVVCKGKIKCCKFCESITFSDEYCKMCGRPLWKKAGDDCSTIVGYFESVLKNRGNEQLGIHFVCRNCTSVTSI